MAARLHHQREGRLRGERHRHLVRVLRAFAETIPSQRDAALHLKEQRPGGLAPRGAQDDMRDRIPVRHPRESLERLLEVERAFLTCRRRRRFRDVVPGY